MRDNFKLNKRRVEEAKKKKKEEKKNKRLLEKNSNAPSEPAPESVIEAGPLRIDAVRREVTRAGAPVHLTVREFPGIVSQSDGDGFLKRVRLAKATD